MGELRRSILCTAMQLFDAVIITFAFVLATFAVYSELTRLPFSEYLSIRVQLSNFGLFVALIVVCHLFFRLQGIYRSKRLAKPVDVSIDIIKAVSMSTLAVSMAAVVFEIEMVTWAFLAVFWASNTLILILSRFVLRQTLSYARGKGRNLRDVVIVGTNPRAVHYAQTIANKPELGYRVLGFVDESWSGIGVLQHTGYPLIATFPSFGQFLRETVVDEVVVGLPLKSNYQRAYEIVEACEQQGIIVRLLGGIFDLKVAHAKAERFEDETVLSLYAGSMEGWPVIVKRVLDIILSSVLLLLLLPLFVITAVLIKMTSPGPICFIQERVGMNKRRFRLFKFRTMVPDAEQKIELLAKFNEVSGPVFKIKNDPRITPLGRFLRKTSIDELLQLINVLKGDMSLVGPRPLPLRDYQGFNADWHRRRFSVRPGITCLWQVNGRSSIPFEKWMELDIEYIDHWSLWLDLKILVKTIPAVLKGSGAT
jgi:exopolysaccharide biosynthesis polyprenyl glycosylphosphotransferase